MGSGRSGWSARMASMAAGVTIATPFESRSLKALRS